MNDTFPATWGSIFNLSNGAIEVGQDVFTLVPDALMTGATLAIGKKAYTQQQYPISEITGYSKVFMAWMAIHFANGTKLKVSLSPGVKRRFIAAPASSPPAEWPCRRSNAPFESNRTLKLNYGIIPGRRSPTQPGIFYV